MFKIIYHNITLTVNTKPFLLHCYLWTNRRNTPNLHGVTNCSHPFVAWLLWGFCARDSQSIPHLRHLSLIGQWSIDESSYDMQWIHRSKSLNSHWRWWHTVLTQDNLENFWNTQFTVIGLGIDACLFFEKKTILQLQDSRILTEQFVAAKLRQGSE